MCQHSEAEIFIWDLNNPTEHLTPGPKVNVRAPNADGDDCSCDAALGRHQLRGLEPAGAVHPGLHVAERAPGRVGPAPQQAGLPVLRVRSLCGRKSCTINLVYCSGKLRLRSCAWHPDEAVQLAVASEDDRAPVIQVTTVLMIPMLYTGLHA